MSDNAISDSNLLSFKHIFPVQVTYRISDIGKIFNLISDIMSDWVLFNQRFRYRPSQSDNVRTQISESGNAMPRMLHRGTVQVWEGEQYANDCLTANNNVGS